MNPHMPYFFDGRLHLPAATLHALMSHGIDVKTAQCIRKGVALDDTATLQTIQTAIEAYTETTPDSEISQAIRENDVQFMLTGSARA